jgi:hypothetical protein
LVKGRRGIDGSRSVARQRTQIRLAPIRRPSLARLLTTEVKIVKGGRIHKDGCLGGN